MIKERSPIDFVLYYNSNHRETSATSIRPSFIAGDR